VTLLKTLYTPGQLDILSTNEDHKRLVENTHCVSLRELLIAE